MRVSFLKSFVVSVAGVLMATAVAGPATADGPGVGTPTIVSIGDSSISGEAGRWAGNTNLGNAADDAFGPPAYWDTPTGESILGCHRSQSAEVHINRVIVPGEPSRPDVNTKNLACSGAMTTTYEYGSGAGRRFKPGLDIFGAVDSAGNYVKKGQLRELADYARTHNVTAIVVAIGANDFDFNGIVKHCMEKYLVSRTYLGTDYCHNDREFTEPISAANQALHAGHIFESLRDMAYVMEWAGYSKDQYTVILQNYWSAIPESTRFRYADAGLIRQKVGGCGLLGPDADALNNKLLKAINDTVLRAATLFRFEPWFPKIRFVDMSGALVGHRLCEQGVGLIEEVPFLTKGYSRDAADKVEWVAQARTLTTSTGGHEMAEGGHANYWGQLALRNCLRQAYNNGNPRNGTCLPAPGGGVNLIGEPNMTLAPKVW